MSYTSKVRLIPTIGHKDPNISDDSSCPFKVMCVINNPGGFIQGSNALVKDKTYTVTNVWRPRLSEDNEITEYYFVSDGGVADYYPSNFFKTMVEVRDDKLNELGID